MGLSKCGALGKEVGIHRQQGVGGLVVDGSLGEAGKHPVAGGPISVVMPVPCIHGCHSLPHTDPEIGDTGGTGVSHVSVGLCAPQGQGFYVNCSLCLESRLQGQ